MYALLWRVLPGPIWVKTLLTLAIVIIVLLLCFSIVFPWLNNFINATEVTVQN